MRRFVEVYEDTKSAIWPGLVIFVIFMVIWFPKALAQYNGYSDDIPPVKDKLVMYVKEASYDKEDGSIYTEVYIVNGYSSAVCNITKSNIILLNNNNEIIDEVQFGSFAYGDVIKPNGHIERSFFFSTDREISDEDLDALKIKFSYECEFME